MKTVIARIIIIITLAMMLVGCYTQKKARRQVVKAQAVHPYVVSSLCGDLYPPLTLIKDSVIHKKGETLISDTLFMTVDCDTVFNEVSKTKLVKVPCPHAVLRTDTIFITKERQVVNTAEIETLNKKLSDLNIESAKRETRYSILLKVAIGLAAYTVLRWVFRIWKIKIP